MYAVLIALGLLPCILPCYLWGTDSGVCTLLTFDPVWKLENMPFCSGVVSYSACIPKYQKLPATRDFPDGRWFNHTTLTKDTWVRESALSHIAVRIGYERNRTLKNTGRNEYGDVGITKSRFYNNPDCENAYKNYFCWINFPRCDYQTDQTMPTCRSACENYFHSCGYENDLWRCGSSEYFNGYAPEPPSIDPVSGNLTYIRDYFPGQPFVGNKFLKSGEEVPICTPALKGAATASAPLFDRILLPVLSMFTIAIVLSTVV
jgi:hypothetical protein